METLQTIEPNQIDNESPDLNIYTQKILKKKHRINEYNKKWIGDKYNNNPDFRAKTKLRYYAKRYCNDPMLKVILEQDIPDGKKFQMVLQYMTTRKS
jgi:hypothetical protein